MRFCQVWLQRWYSSLLNYMTFPRNSFRCGRIDCRNQQCSCSNCNLSNYDNFAVKVIRLLNSYSSFAFYWIRVSHCFEIVWFFLTTQFHNVKLYHVLSVNLLQPTDHVMHQQFNIQQLYALPTLYLCVLYLRTIPSRLGQQIPICACDKNTEYLTRLKPEIYVNSA